MYFIDELHERNFKHLTKMVFPQSKVDVEYEVLSYILALPEIYERCIEDPLLSEYPLLWIKDYIYSEKLIPDEEFGDYLEEDIEIKKNSDGKEMESEGFARLSHGFKLMVYLGANLFNSSEEEFNLTYSINRWDTHLIKVFYQALKIRFPNKLIDMLND